MSEDKGKQTTEPKSGDIKVPLPKVKGVDLKSSCPICLFY